MAEKVFPVVNNGDTPTLFVNVDGAKVSIERMDAGMVVISQEEARRLAVVLLLAMAEARSSVATDVSEEKK